LIIFTCLINTSCASFRENSANKNLIELSTENISLINGVYLNNTDKKVLPSDYFWGANYKMKEYESVYKLVYEKNYPYYIKLKALNDRQIEITIIVDDKILKSYTINGKLKNGYFEQNRKMYIIPALIINVYHSSKFRIGLLNNGNLVTDYRKIEFGIVLTPPFYFNNTENSQNIEHKKLSELND